MVLACNLHRRQRIARLLNIRFIQSSLRRIVVGDKGYRAASQVAAKRDHSSDCIIDGIWLGKILANIPYVVLQDFLCRVERAFDEDGFQCQLHLGMLLQLFFHQVVRVVVLRKRQQLKEQSRHDNNQQSLPFPERQDKFSQFTHAGQ